MKIRNWITTFGLWICLIMVSWLILGIIFGSYKDFFPFNAIDLSKYPKLWSVFKDKNSSFLFILTIIETIIAIIIGLLIFKYRQKIQKLHNIPILNSFYLSAILFLILILTTFFYYDYDKGPITSDLFEVVRGAKKYFLVDEIMGGSKRYFERYPNNLGLLWYEIGVFKILGISYLNIFIVNAILFFSSVTFSFFAILKKIKSFTKANLFLITLILFLPIYAYVSFLYTDIIAASFFLFFFAILILCYNPGKLPLGAIIALSLIGAIGATFRANLYFAIVALIIWLVLYEKKWRKLTFLIVLAIVLGYSSAFKAASSSFFNFDLKSTSFPATHWIRMGQNEVDRGNYSREDFNHTYIEIYEKHNTNIAKDNLNDAIERIKEKGFIGNIIFYSNKLSNAWGNGDFGVFNNLSIFTKNKNTIENLLPEYNENSLAPKKISATNKAYAARIFLDIYSRIFYVLLALFMFNVIRKRDYINNRLFLIFTLTFVASILFLLAWESRARYAFSIMPSLILVINYMLFNQESKSNSLNDKEDNNLIS